MDSYVSISFVQGYVLQEAPTTNLATAYLLEMLDHYFRNRKMLGA